jgi:hypothetical protein
MSFPRSDSGRLRKSAFRCHSEAVFAEESLCGLDLIPREILRFAQNDSHIEFFSRLLEDRYLMKNNSARGILRALARVALVVALVSAGPRAAGAQQAPKELQPPAGEEKLMQVHAKGDQIYACKADGEHFAWTLKAPDAQLSDEVGKPFGKHFAGPTWEANDGSRVTGKAVANAPSPAGDSIPWLLVTAVSRSGEGKLARVTSIQRIHTKGGKAPASGCDAAHAGEEQRAAYSADYVFFAPK